MDPDDSPPPGDPGDLDHHDGNQLATQARYSHDNDVNMEGDDTGNETRLETVDFGTYAATLTVNSNDDANDGNNTLEIMLRKTALPEDQIQAILAANRSETTGNRKIPRNWKSEMQRNTAAGNNEMHDDDGQELKHANITPLKKITSFKQKNPKGKNMTSNSFTY